ncbi:hypothetical protein [Methanolobus vulcani]|uniref:Uncharacterized protein n=1 Tax=Methanolobus vulcani TaxID=38026 RepID=A0A7Z8KQX0_9EURY|nr:hypothetical protein [Methanolobus vulcani]TQD28448.1 hypothetical protein FKV42_01970 [Methanolobus vulcani]
MGILDEIENTRSLLLGILVLVGFVSFAIPFIGMDISNPDKTDENMEIIVEKTPDAIIPTEITWIQNVSNKVDNPYVLLILIIGIFWFFGYFKK